MNSWVDVVFVVVVGGLNFGQVLRMVRDAIVKNDNAKKGGPAK